MKKFELTNIIKKCYPQSPADWNDANQTLYRSFKFRSTGDIEILQRLVKEHIPNRGNNSYLRARLLGILSSMYSDVNRRFWIKHYHPKTWWWRYQFQTSRRWFRRVFKTRAYQSETFLCNCARDVAYEMKLNSKS